ncbi:hypothetical protein SDC9_15152 [bioreactor metagenome]|uniref:Uncharacterized protein n=1 Tax=bioreactor metagenome TaxID=1076179 RepID=A0A644TUP7_9ZZZZ|nr:hypothetical protein [Negativicutes bacterium]
MTSFTKHFIKRYITCIATGMFVLTLSLLILGCSSSNQPVNSSEKLRTPFIPPTDSSVITGSATGTGPQDLIGSASVVLDNSQNGYHARVALFKITESRKQLTSIITIRKNEQFTANNLAAGTYEIQYQNLYTGKFFKLNPALTITDHATLPIPLNQKQASDFSITPLFHSSF